MMGRRILITGSREWTDTESIHTVLADELAQTPPDSFLVVVHGGAKSGADKIADDWAYSMLRRGKRVRCEQLTALWDEPLSAVSMVEHGATVCHGFPKGDSEGTRHCMQEAQKAGIPVIEHAGSQNQ